MRRGAIVALVALTETVDGTGLVMAADLVGIHCILALVTASEDV